MQPNNSHWILEISFQPFNLDYDYDNIFYDDLIKKKITEYLQMKIVFDRKLQEIYNVHD